MRTKDAGKERLPREDLGGLPVTSYGWDFTGLARTKESVDVARTSRGRRQGTRGSCAPFSKEPCFFFFF